MKKTNGILGIIMLGFMISACKKDSTNTTPAHTYPYAVHMTDAPGPYDAVYIDLLRVEIVGSNGQVELLNVHAGIYNLLDFTNGADTLIATGSLGVGSVQQIRLILGANNSVVVDNVSYPLSTPSADQSGLKLQVHQTLQAGVLYNVLIDFDANQSIVLTGNGTYKLKPVLKTVEIALSGAIRGSISPLGVAAFVTATSGTSFYSSGVSNSSAFLLMGLPAGNYAVTVTPSSPFNAATKNNVTVITGATTNIGTIIL